MFSNSNALNVNSTAWTSSVHKRKDQMFAKIQGKLTQGLKNTVDTATVSMIPCQARGYCKDVEYLWDLVHCEAVTKVWTIFEPDSEFKSRTHSATLFRSLEEYCTFVLCDPRLIFYSDPPKQLSSAFFPWKRFDPSVICPPGVQDATDLNNVQASRVANYQLWLQKMQSCSQIRVLKSTSNMDVSELKQFPVLPLRMVANGDNGSFVTVFIPASLGSAEMQLTTDCKTYLLGKLLFGSSYRAGGKFDLLLCGYWCAVPSSMVKQDTSTGRFFFRTCRWFERPNIGADHCCVDAQVTLSLTPCMLNNATSTFSFPQVPTVGKLNLSSQRNAHP